MAEPYDRLPSGSAAETPPAKKRRNRIKRSCKPCTERHIKCDLMVPCFSCIQRDQRDICLIDNPSFRKQQYQAPALSPQHHHHHHHSLSPYSYHRPAPTHKAASYPNTTEADHNSIPTRPGLNSSSSQFSRFLDECGSALNGKVDAIKGLSNKDAIEYLAEYSKEVQDELRIIQKVLPIRAADTIQMLRKFITLSAWFSCPADFGKHIGIADPSLSELYISSTSSGSFGHCNVYESTTVNIFPCSHKIGDAARLSLIIAMVLGAVSLSSIRLVALTYNLDMPTESLLGARKKLEQDLELALRAALRLSRIHDGTGLDNAVRAGLLYVYYLKNSGRIEYTSSKMFQTELVDMVKVSGLHRLDSNQHFLSRFEADQLESKRILFYEYLAHDRFRSAVFAHPTDLPPEEITTLAPQVSSETCSVIFRASVASTLVEAHGILLHGASSYEQIEEIDQKLVSKWNQIRREHGSLQEAFHGRDRRRFTDALIYQVGYSACRVMVYRSSFSQDMSRFGKEAIWKSRMRLYEAVSLAVEAQETIRYTMESDEVMSSMYASWGPAEFVVTLLLAALMALRESITNQNETTHRNSMSNNEDFQKALNFIASAKVLASRSRRCLKSAPPGSFLAEKALEMLDRVGKKADAVLSSKSATQSSTTTIEADTSLDTNVGYYQRDGDDHHLHRSSELQITARTSKDISPMSFTALDTNNGSLAEYAGQDTPETPRNLSLTENYGPLFRSEAQNTRHESNSNFFSSYSSRSDLDKWFSVQEQQTQSGKESHITSSEPNLRQGNQIGLSGIREEPDTIVVQNAAIEELLDSWLVDLL